jgi:hypothetical protein
MVSFVPNSTKLAFLLTLYMEYPAAVGRKGLEDGLQCYTSFRPLMKNSSGQGQKAAENVKYDLALQGLLTIEKEGPHRR